LGAEQLLAAEKGGRRIAVEIKSFLGDSVIEDLENAIGQFAVYRAVLAEIDPDRILYLAVPLSVVRDIFDEPFGKLLLQHKLAQVIGFDPQTEVLAQWVL
jgi:XisH protein